MLGVALLLLVVGENFTGYLLPWDQLAYWAVTVGSSLLSYVLLVVGFLVLTVIGIFFRGEGIALMWPWEVMR